jgi:hypothetical protein
MMGRWRDAVGPNEAIDVETLLVTYYFFAENLLFNKKHLHTCELSAKPGRYQRP